MRLRRAFASWQVLVVLAALAGVLLFIQRGNASHDVELATGPPKPEQSVFFDQMAERPDLDLFFKALRQDQRLAMARNLGANHTVGATKTAVRLLASLDDSARLAITDSLSKIARQNPEWIAAELGRGGSFERIGIFHALVAAGETGMRAAAEALSDPGRRQNAILFLVQSKNNAVAYLLPLLDHKDSGTRAAAAEALGKLQSPHAIGPLLAKLKAASNEERTVYLTALADIGSPKAEQALLDAVEVRGVAGHSRLVAGLGRVATPASISRLEEIAQKGDFEDKEVALEALTLSGNRALERLRSEELRLAVASKLLSPQADKVIRGALSNPNQMRDAIGAAAGRPALAKDLWPAQIGPDDPSVPQRMQGLSTTQDGNRILAKLAQEPGFSGFAKRALALSSQR